LRYWYRTSPQPMVATEFEDSSLTPGRINTSDPPLTLSGMTETELDPQGRLMLFQAIPPELEDKPQGAKPVDWAPLFAAAGLDVSQLKPADPLWNSLASSDTRVAWTGTWPGSNRPLRVEAAALHGTPVFFSLIGPWTKAPRLNPFPETRHQQISEMLLVGTGLTVLAAAVFIARATIKKGVPT
jgi:hypothetical protein